MTMPLRITRGLSTRTTVWALGLALCVGGCAGEVIDPPERHDMTLEPAAPTLVRLTRAQYDNSIRALLGDSVVLPSTLEPDAPQDGLLALGAALTTISPHGVELYEKAAMSLATQAIANPELRATLIPCPAAAGVGDCLLTVAETFGRRAWRRPLTAVELDRLVNKVGVPAATTLGTLDAGATYIIAAILQSTHFLYRIELGEPDYYHPKFWLLNPYELASRLSFFMWNSTPDDALLDAAANGALDTPEGYLAQVERLQASPLARQGIRTFFSDWLQLYTLDRLSKDPNIFRHFTSDLGAMAREETLRLVDELFVDGDANLGEFFTTPAAWVNRRLAAIYDIPAPAEEGFARTVFSEASQRRGFFGQVSFLGSQAHEVISSPTLRGIFVREFLLCEPVPPPPSNLNTAIPEPSATARTLRERLTSHMEDPVCATCHGFTDPIGLGFENFDGIGRFRVTDHGAIIDPSGDLDGEVFEDARQLGERVAASPSLGACIVKKLYESAVGHGVEPGEEAAVAALAEAFEADGRRFRNLMRAVALSDGFRRVGGIK
ncbi:MAG: DUF1592 domain-containing protein [Myxococcota bacterium]